MNGTDARNARRRPMPAWVVPVGFLALVLNGIATSEADTVAATISASGPDASPNPAYAEENIAATVWNVNAVVPSAAGFQQLVADSEELTFAYSWTWSQGGDSGSFSGSTTNSATGSFAAAGTYTIIATVTVSGTADYTYTDDEGNVQTVQKSVTGTQDFEVDVQVNAAGQANTITVSDLGMYSVNKTGITVEATVTNDGSPVSGATVTFSSSALTFTGSNPATTNAQGKATVTASAGSTPSGSRDGSSVTASVDDGLGSTASAWDHFTVVKVKNPSQTEHHILVGGYEDDSLYSVVLTFEVSPGISGVPIAFAFEGEEGKGVEVLGRLEDAATASDGNGKATVRVRSSDLEETATVQCTFQSSSGSTDVTFDPITGI